MYSITIQKATDKTLFPKSASIRKWAKKALEKQIEVAEVTIRIVGIDEMTMLNKTYRHKSGPTNVLSFPINLPEDVALSVPMLGDIVICADVVNREADEQIKAVEAHWAHMVIHGIFHLLGYDHENDEDAKIMETLEINVLLSLGFPNPYETGDH